MFNKTYKFKFFNPETGESNDVRIWSPSGFMFSLCSDKPLTRKQILNVQDAIGYPSELFTPVDGFEYRQRYKLGKNFLRWSVYDH